MDSQAEQQQTPKRSYDRDFLLRLQHTGSKPNPVITEALQQYLLVKGTGVTPKKTPYKSPMKQTPSKVYVLKTPTKEVPSSPSKFPSTPAAVSTPNFLTATKPSPAKTAASPSKFTPSKAKASPSKPTPAKATAPLAGNRVPLGVVKGPRSTPSRPATNSALPSFAIKENNVENIVAPSVAAGPVAKLVLPTPAAAADKGTPASAASPAASPEHSSAKKGEKESDEHRLAQRQKQIEYGKRTVGYQRYISMVPRDKRKPGDPVTPRKNQKCSKRSWDGQVRKWRRELHKWDPTDEAEIQKWKAIIKEKFGDIHEEEDDLDLSTPPILQQAKNNLFVMDDMQSITRTLVF